MVMKDDIREKHGQSEEESYNNSRAKVTEQVSQIPRYFDWMILTLSICLFPLFFLIKSVITTNFEKLKT